MFVEFTLSDMKFISFVIQQTLFKINYSNQEVQDNSYLNLAATIKQHL